MPLFNEGNDLDILHRDPKTKFLCTPMSTDSIAGANRPHPPRGGGEEKDKVRSHFLTAWLHGSSLFLPVWAAKLK
jgi:hypothetical protein